MACLKPAGTPKAQYSETLFDKWTEIKTSHGSERARTHTQTFQVCRVKSCMRLFLFNVLLPCPDPITMHGNQSLFITANSFFFVPVNKISPLSWTSWSQLVWIERLWKDCKVKCNAHCHFTSIRLSIHQDRLNERLGTQIHSNFKTKNDKTYKRIKSFH